MPKKKRRKFTVKKEKAQQVHLEAVHNLDRLWKLTEQAAQEPLTPTEQQTVQRIRLLLMLLAEDMAGRHNPPLSEYDTLVVRQEIESLLQQAPFAGLEDQT
jgi:predicted nucleic acid-binding protein